MSIPRYLYESTSSSCTPFSCIFGADGASFPGAKIILHLVVFSRILFSLHHFSIPLTISCGSVPLDFPIM